MVKKSAGSPVSHSRVVALEQIHYVPLTLRVHRLIKDRILSGEIPLGARLRDEDLAAQLRVSRTPVREALMILAREGLVEIVPRSCTRVRTFTERDLEEIFDLRAALETLAVRRAIDRVPPDRLKTLCAMYRKAEAALKRGEARPVFDFDREMHRTILDACGNQRLRDMMVTINDYVTLFRNISETTTTHRGHTAKHREILGALERRDPETAARALAEHLLVAKEQTLRDFVQRQLLNSNNREAENGFVGAKTGPAAPAVGTTSTVELLTGIVDGTKAGTISGAGRSRKRSSR